MHAVQPQGPEEIASCVTAAEAMTYSIFMVNSVTTDCFLLHQEIVPLLSKVYAEVDFSLDQIAGIIRVVCPWSANPIRHNGTRIQPCLSGISVLSCQ